MTFIVDASVGLAWCFPEEETTVTKKLLDRLSYEVAVVPGWWFIELTNILALSEKKGRISAEEVAEFIFLIEGFTFDVDDEAPGRAFDYLLPLCRMHRLTSYDAIYLDLALRRRLPLATLDRSLGKAAKKLGVKTLCI